MLFAAGLGTRMGELTRNRPKPLIEVGGKTLLDHTLELARDVNPARIVANTHYLSHQIRDHLAGQNVRISDEQPLVLETGGGLRKALPLLGEGPVYTANTDAIWRGPNPFELLRQAWRPEEMDALLLCVPRNNAVGHSGKGDFLIDASGRLSRGPGLVYGGVQIIKTGGLHAIEDEAFSLNLLWDRMHRDLRLFGLEYSGKWCDVGTPAGIDLAENMLKGCDV